MEPSANRDGLNAYIGLAPVQVHFAEDPGNGDLENDIP